MAPGAWLAVGATGHEVQDRGNRDAQAPDAGPAAHHSWIVRDAGERHGSLDVGACWLRQRGFS